MGKTCVCNNVNPLVNNNNNKRNVRLGKKKGGGLPVPAGTASNQGQWLPFAWTLTLIPVAEDTKNPIIANLPVILNPFLAMFEILRRMVWGFLRIENEHLHNTEGYRRVALVPMHFDTVMDKASKTLLFKKHGPGWKMLLEVLAIVAVAVAIGITAVLCRSSD